MATFTVNTSTDVIADDGKSSLREAVRQANATAAADTIVFTSALEGRMLALAQGELTVKQDVTIDGDRNDDGKEVTLSGNDTSRILHITGYGTEVSLRQLTLTEGKSTARGGAILADRYSALHLTGATVAGNTVVGDADYAALCGGIYSLGDLTVSDSSVSGNTAVDGAGGGIWGGRVLWSTARSRTITQTPWPVGSAASGSR